MRLEPEFWDALAEIAHREGVTASKIVKRIQATNPVALTSAVRTFIISYFRSAVTKVASK